MDLKSTQLKDTYGNLLTIGETAGSPTTGTLENGDGEDITSLTLAGTTDSTFKISSNRNDIILFENDTTDNNTLIRQQSSLLRFDTIADDLTTITRRITLNIGNGDISFRDGSASEAFYWDASAGSLGIGTTLPDAALHAKSSGSTYLKAERTTAESEGALTLGAEANENAIYSRDGGFGGKDLDFIIGTTTAMTIDSSGNVGIGTDAPNSNLSVLKNQTSDTAIEVSNLGSVGATTTASFLLSETPGTPKGWFRRYRDGTARTSIGYDGSFIIESTAGTERMRIDSSGNVGIGTSTPSSKLDIQQGTAGNIISAEFDNTDYTANNRNAIKIRQATSAGSSFSTFLGTDKDTGNVFLSNDSITADHFVINTSGQVGIGTNSPSTTLDVKGTISLQATNSTNKWLAYTYTDNTLRLNYNGAGNDEVLINSSGQVGIGVSPLAKLHVNDTTYPALRLSTATSYSNIYHDGTTGSITYSADDGNAIAGSSHQFYVDGSSAMTIDSSGNVILQTVGAQLRFQNSLGPAPYIENSGEDASTAPYGQDLLFATGGSESMRILSGGDVSFAMQDFSSSPSNTVYGLRLVTGTTGKSYWKSAVNADTTHYHYEFLNTNGSVGNISTSASATAYNTSSDYRLKENVVPMEGALDKVAQLKPSTFNFIADADTTVDGFLAHEVAEIVPNAVSGEKDAVDEEGNPMYQGIDHSKLVPILVGAIQELKAEIEQLKNQ
jgi:hypothetical protein